MAHSQQRFHSSDCIKLYCGCTTHPTRYIILTATPLFLLVAVAIGLEYNAAHSSVARRLSRLAVVGVVVGRRQSALRVVSNSRRQSAAIAIM